MLKNINIDLNKDVFEVELKFDDDKFIVVLNEREVERLVHELNVGLFEKYLMEKEKQNVI